MSSSRTPEETVRAFFAAYSDGAPERFDDVVASDYVDYGHTPPGRGPQGAKDDYAHAVEQTGGVTHYDIDAVVTRDDTVAVVWTARTVKDQVVRGLSLYRVTDGRVAETRHTGIPASPS